MGGCLSTCTGILPLCIHSNSVRRLMCTCSATVFWSTHPSDPVFCPAMRSGSWSFPSSASCLSLEPMISTIVMARFSTACPASSYLRCCSWGHAHLTVWQRQIAFTCQLFCQQSKSVFGFLGLRKSLILIWRTHQELNLKPSDP